MATTPHHPEPAGDTQAVGPERLNMLCDGVVAIAITFLALEIKLPEGYTGSVHELLLDKLPAVTSFFISFVVIGIFWLAHHRITHHVARSSGAFNLANLGFMLALVSINFPTAVLSHYHHSEPLAVILYASVVAFAGAMLLVMNLVAHRQRLFEPGLPRERWPGLSGAGLPTAVFLLSIPIALVNAQAAQLFWIVAALDPLVARLRRR